jgi:hypothetical protein
MGVHLYNRGLMKASSIVHKESCIILSKVEVEKKFGSNPESAIFGARMLNQLNLGTHSGT